MCRESAVRDSTAIGGEGAAEVSAIPLTRCGRLGQLSRRLQLGRLGALTAVHLTVLLILYSLFISSSPNALPTVLVFDQHVSQALLGLLALALPLAFA